MAGGCKKESGARLPGEIKVINMGITSFARALNEQGVTMIHVDWKPPAGGDARLMELLKKMKR